LTFKANYKDGQYHGLFERYNNFGELLRKGNFKDDKLHGLQEYYKNGKSYEDCYKNDEQTDMSYCEK
jgi:antitoxin component YwqK of YwqJK toxin-antitoxin module